MSNESLQVEVVVSLEQGDTEIKSSTDGLEGRSLDEQMDTENSQINENITFNNENEDLALTSETNEEINVVDSTFIDELDCEIPELLNKLLGESEKYLNSTNTFAAPDLNVKEKPLQITGAWSAFLKKSNNFTKGCKWAPDGSCVLTNSEDQHLRLFDLPTQLFNPVLEGQELELDKFQELTPSLEIKEADLVYDYAWYPLMNSSDPSTCCFLTTNKDQPIHLWDAFTGFLRSTYKAYDHLDEVVAAYSLAFDPFGQHIYSGYNNMIRVFDIAVPGREFRDMPTKVKKEGQPGIISCLAVNPTNHRIIAAGSYCKTIALYLEPRGDSLCVLAGQRGGLTHILFSPDGNHIYTGGRKDPEILCWDIRSPGKILYSLRRNVNTNQRMYFDISQNGCFVVSGSYNGVVTIWDTKVPPIEVPGFEEPILEPTLYFQGHDDCVNGASFHPYLPLLATSSGQRKLKSPLESDSDSDNSLSENKEDNSLRFWWLK